jgi:hypothetical protein
MRRFFIPVAILIVVAFILFVARETRETVALATSVHPMVGHGVLIVLLLIYAACLAVPLVAFIRLPRPLVPPPPDDPAKLDAYLARLAKRLRTNKNLPAQNIAADQATVEQALLTLDSLARQRIVQAATAVFAGTAVSQSGRLDGLMVLVAQTRLVWQIAHLYWQRPGVRELVYLYGNVATGAFIAQNIDDFDFSDLVEPILAPVLANSAVSAIPGFGPVANVVADATIEGTVNAFLTLRVGCLASGYCRSLTAPDARVLRKTATVQAGGMLAAVAREGAERVAASIWAAVKRSKAGGAATALARIASRAADHVASAVAAASEKSGANAAAGLLARVVTQAAASASTAIGQRIGRTTPDREPG